MQAESCESLVAQDGERLAHVALALMARADPVADLAALRNPAAHIAERDPAENASAPPFADEIGITCSGGDFLVVAANAAAKGGLLEIVGRPCRLPRFPA